MIPPIPGSRAPLRTLRRLAFCLLALLVFLHPSAFQSIHADTSFSNAFVRSELPVPPGSAQFGYGVFVLHNGNFVVTDPAWESGKGAAYLYDGGTLQIISRITGTNPEDRVAIDGVVVLASGNFVVQSPHWTGSETQTPGAQTWGDAERGFLGGERISAANSLLGGTYTVALKNGNYVVVNPGWSREGAERVGAVTWGNGASGTVGIVSAANSLTGSTAQDSVGSGGVVPLENGNYVVISERWDNGGAADAGAVTWGDGIRSTAKTVSTANSLVGGKYLDQVGIGGVVPLSNGNYVVGSPDWDNGSILDTGAVTWGNGALGSVGVVTSANSLVGSRMIDSVGAEGDILALPSGNYLVRSLAWDNGDLVDAGAVTWGNGSGGTVGEISAANSLVGNAKADPLQGPVFTLVVLANGNYVVVSPLWSPAGNGGFGAVTWGSGVGGVKGVISAANSLTGSQRGDGVGSRGVFPLPNGDYVVASPGWQDEYTPSVGAVTLGNGATGITGQVSAANSLIGALRGDEIGLGGVTVLTNGNYVVSSPSWSSSEHADIGALTWMQAGAATAGAVSAANSMIGTVDYDRLGSEGVFALANGNYVARSRSALTWGNGATGTLGVVGVDNSLVAPFSQWNDFFDTSFTPLANGNYVLAIPGWDDGALENLGAVTWFDGAAPVTGQFSVAKSLVGTMAEDRVGDRVLALANGNYVVSSPTWDQGGVQDVGAVTWGDGIRGVAGKVSAANSLVGVYAGDALWAYEAVVNGNYLVRSHALGDYGTTGPRAFAYGDGSTGTTGVITNANGILFSRELEFIDNAVAYNQRHGYLLVGAPTLGKVFTFAGQPNALTVTRSGNGFGTVVSSAGGIVCGSKCSGSIAQGMTVTLTAIPGAVTRFAGWGGACSSATTTICTITMDAAKSVTANFVHDPAALNPLMLLPAVRK